MPIKSKKRALNGKESNTLRKNSKKIRLNQCSPRKGEETFTCFTRPSLKRIIRYWNESNPQDVILFNDTETKGSLWNKINKRLSKICDNEYCWLEQPFISNKNELDGDYRPKMPLSWIKNNREWLTTSDIENVMNQYMKKYDDFFFVGAVPIDFDKRMSPGMCVVDELCKIKMSNLLKRGIYQIGIVFNLDPHDKPGSHWVSFYGNFNTGKLYYFDSYGFKPPKEVKKLVERLIEQGKTNNIKIDYKQNKVRHQFKESECGVYSMHFIENMLEGKSFDSYCNSDINDDKMNRLRNKYFVKRFS
jgi:Ulp1 family protease